MADPNDQRLVFPCYELWHDYDHIDLRQRELRPEERQALKGQLATMLQLSWKLDDDFFRQPVTQFVCKSNTYDVPSLFGEPLKNFAHSGRFAISMYLDSHAQALMLAKSAGPFPCLAELRVFPLPGKTLFSCTVAVCDLCGIVVQAQYKGQDPLELRTTFVRQAITQIDTLFEGESLDANLLQIALCQFGEYYIDK